MPLLSRECAAGPQQDHAHCSRNPHKLPASLALLGICECACHQRAPRQHERQPLDHLLDDERQTPRTPTLSEILDAVGCTHTQAFHALRELARLIRDQEAYVYTAAGSGGRTSYKWNVWLEASQQRVPLDTWVRMFLSEQATRQRTPTLAEPEPEPDA